LRRLEACVHSVREQDYPSGKIQILVTLPMQGRVVDGIVDIRGWCQEAGVGLVEYIHNEPGWTPSLSRNIGYRKADGDILVSLDADGVLDTRTFTAAVAHMDKKRCAVRVRTSLTPRPVGDPVFSKLGRKAFRRTVDMGRKAPGPGCCILAPRAAVFKIRGWDEKFVGYGPADWDFVERLEKGGYPVLNLSETDDIWTLHQDHKRKLGTPLQHKNRAYHAKSKFNRDPVRNKGGWGGE